MSEVPLYANKSGHAEPEPLESTQGNRMKGTFRGLYYERDASTISDDSVVT